MKLVSQFYNISGQKEIERSISLTDPKKYINCTVRRFSTAAAFWINSSGIEVPIGKVVTPDGNGWQFVASAFDRLIVPL